MKSGMMLVAGTALLIAGAALAQQAPSTGSGAQGQPAAAPAPAGGPPPAPKPVTLASRPGATGGEALYLVHCSHCHGPNGMGTGLIGRRTQPALLESRGNLSVPVITAFVRQGLGNMPPVPRGEVSDSELQAIAEYLAAGPHPAATGPAQ